MPLFLFFPLKLHLYKKKVSKISERNGASPDDFTKWEVAKIAKTSPQLEVKNANRVVEKKYRKDQEL